MNFLVTEGQRVSLNITSYMNNDPALILIFLTLSLFGALTRYVFSDKPKKDKSKSNSFFKMLLSSITSAIVMFSSLEYMRHIIDGNALYLIAILSGFISEMLLNQLSKIRSVKGVIQFLDDLYTFLRNRK